MAGKLTEAEIDKLMDSVSCTSVGRENPILELLDKTQSIKTLKLLDDGICCRTCKWAIWMARKSTPDLVCFCHVLRSLTWQSDNPKKSEIYLCAARHPLTDHPLTENDV